MFSGLGKAGFHVTLRTHINETWSLLVLQMVLLTYAIPWLEDDERDGLNSVSTNKYKD